MMSFERIAMSQNGQPGTAGILSVTTGGCPERKTGIANDDPARALPVVRNIRAGRSSCGTETTSLRSRPVSAPPVAIEPTIRLHDPLATGVESTTASTDIDANCTRSNAKVTAVNAAAARFRSIVGWGFYGQAALALVQGAAPQWSRGSLLPRVFVRS